MVYCCEFFWLFALSLSTVNFLMTKTFVHFFILKTFLTIALISSRFKCGHVGILSDRLCMHLKKRVSAGGSFSSKLIYEVIDCFRTSLTGHVDYETMFIWNSHQICHGHIEDSVWLRRPFNHIFITILMLAKTKFNIKIWDTCLSCSVENFKPLIKMICLQPIFALFSTFPFVWTFSASAL